MPFQLPEVTDALFFTTWTTLAAFQATTAAIDAWKLWKKWRRPTTDYERVLNGETRRGWQLAIPMSKVCKNYHQAVIEAATESFCTFRYWKNGLDDESELMTPPPPSIVFGSINPLPSGKTIYRIRRFSLLQPNANVTLLKIVADPERWDLTDCHHLTSRNLMVIFEKFTSQKFRVVLFDMYLENYRIVKIKLPENSFNWFYLSVPYLEKKSPILRLHLLFRKYDFTPIEHGHPIRLEFIDVAYDVSEGRNFKKAIAPSSLESISFPVGHKTEFYNAQSIGLPITFVAKHPGEQNTDEILCFTFDQGQKWKQQTMTQWLADFGKSSMGRRILNAGKSFLDLSPPSDWRWFVDINAIKEFCRLRTVPNSEALLAGTDYGGCLKCWIRPPSLLRTAAEHLFQANPELKMSDVRKATGVDLSDGIPDEDEEKCETMTIR